MKIIRSTGPEIFDIDLEKDLLAKNNNLAKGNRKRFDRLNILTIDIMGSIGSGKTSLIKAILRRLGMGQSAGSFSTFHPLFLSTMQFVPDEGGKRAGVYAY